MADDAVLFVGGPFDGKWHSIDHYRMEVHVTVPGHSTKYWTVIYRRFRVTPDLDVFAPANVHKEEILKALVEGYRGMPLPQAQEVDWRPPYMIPEDYY